MPLSTFVDAIFFHIVSVVTVDVAQDVIASVKILDVGVSMEAVDGTVSVQWEPSLFPHFYGVPVSVDAVDITDFVHQVVVAVSDEFVYLSTSVDGVDISVSDVDVAASVDAFDIAASSLYCRHLR